jgi:hypothetical protein
MRGLRLVYLGVRVIAEAETIVTHARREELLQALRKFYVRQLLAVSEDVSDSGALSELLWGNRDHMRDAEELVAWQAHAGPSVSDDESSETDTPSTADAPETTADASAKDAPQHQAVPPDGEAEAEVAPRRKKKTTRKKKSTRKKAAKASVETEATEDSEQGDHADMASATDAKKTRRKRPEQDDESAAKDDEDRPRRKKKKKKTTTRKKKATRKKKVAAAPVAAPEPPPMVAMVPSPQVSAAPPEADGILEAEAVLS